MPTPPPLTSSTQDPTRRARTVAEGAPAVKTPTEDSVRRLRSVAEGSPRLYNPQGQ